MANISMLRCVGILGSILCGRIAQGQSLPIPPIIDATARAADPRLNVPLTFDADRMYFGEVLQKVSAQTGVSISIPSAELCSGMPVTCHIKKLPLADFMNSVWSLVSYSKATWQITSKSRQQTRSYALLTTPESLALAGRLSLEGKQASVRLAQMYLKISTMTPQERQAQLHDLASAMLLAKDDGAKSFIEDSPNLNIYWSKIGLFNRALSADQLDQVWKGETVNVPLSSLNARDQEMIRGQVGHSYQVANGVRTEILPDRMIFSFSPYITSFTQKREMMWHLSLGIGTADGSDKSIYMGIMERGLKTRLYEGWILPGDLRSTKIETQTVNRLPDMPAESIWRHSPPFDLLLTQIAEANNVSYIAVLPDDTRNHTADALGKTSGQVFEDLRTNADLMHKWRDGVLLFNYPAWFYGEDAQYPYGIVAQLRERKQSHNGALMTLPDFADMVTSLTDLQIKRLAVEFPQLDSIKAHRSLVHLYKVYPEILSENGMAVDLNMVRVLKDLKLMPPLSDKDTLERMRITDKSIPQINDGRRFYRLQFQSAQRKVWQEIENMSIMPDRRP